MNTKDVMLQYEKYVMNTYVRQPLVLVSKNAEFPEYREFGLKVLW